MKERFWSKDWFAALCFALVFFIAAYTGLLGDSFQSLERFGYDKGVRARAATPSDRIAIVAIDDESIQNLGRWPWPRTLQAQLIDKLREGGAKVIANTALYLEAEQGAGAQVIGGVVDYLKASALVQQIPAEIETFGVMLDDTSHRSRAVKPIAQAYRESALAKDYQTLMTQLLGKLEAAAQGGGSPDAVLAAAIKAHGHVLLPMVFKLGRPQGRPDQPLPDYVQRNALTQIEDHVDARGDGAVPQPALGALAPVPAIGGYAAAIGHLNIMPDIDGAVRYEPLVISYFDQIYPSMSLVIAEAALNLTPADVHVKLGEGVSLADLDIGTSPSLRMYTQFYPDHDGQPAFLADSAFDVLSGKIPLGKYKDKIVLIGTTAVGTGDTFATPASPVTAPVEMLAHAVSSILQEDFFIRPSWGPYVEIALLLLITAYLALLLPRLPATVAALITGTLTAVLLGAQIGLMAASAMWLKLMIPVVFLLSGHLFMTIKQFRLSERGRETSEAEGAESNKMLGLAFQGQGQLDMAFDKFRRVQPVDDRVLDLIYNLALDFERKRQFNKAESAYQYIAGFNKEFRDIPQKLSRAKKLSETVILGGGAGASHPGGTMVMGGDGTEQFQVEKPMLGRYQVEKELGKGAMGVVYMGKDPKINRIVAIKTMALTQEFEPDEQADVKARFFREAETAGRLNHPNIVQIYDAGEEHDLCYIAMEFLKGHDLVRYTKPNALLTMKEVVKIVADSADALDYAHQQGVVHRDIKPANLMLLVDTRVIKVTDFGIARITDSSKTKTGMVLGTPSYMSPEQLSGKKVDGRSDLFSLGVTMYQLLCGALPFQADSMATLMFKIANEPHAPAAALRPDLPPALNDIVEHALIKDVDKRYQRGAELARELRVVLASLN